MKERVLICTFATPEIDAYTKYTIPRMIRYASTHGYDFKIGTKMNVDKHPSWGKIQMILENFNQYDLILFFDADVWINRFEIETVHIGDPKFTIAISKNDLNGGKLLNCGAILVKGKEFQNWQTRSFFAKVWDTASNDWNGFWEQDIINDFYALNYQREQEFIQPLKMREINSWWQDNDINAPDNFVYHLMGRTIEEKVRAFEFLTHRESMKPL